MQLEISLPKRINLDSALKLLRLYKIVHSWPYPKLELRFIPRQINQSFTIRQSFKIVIKKQTKQHKQENNKIEKIVSLNKLKVIKGRIIEELDIHREQFLKSAEIYLARN